MNSIVHFAAESYLGHISLAEGVHRTMEWNLGHEDWGQHVLSGAYVSDAKEFRWLSQT